MCLRGIACSFGKAETSSLGHSHIPHTFTGKLSCGKKELSDALVASAINNHWRNRHVFCGVLRTLCSLCALYIHWKIYTNNNSIYMKNNMDFRYVNKNTHGYKIFVLRKICKNAFFADIIFLLILILFLIPWAL